MIKKLRRKLIAASMLALALVLLVILGGVNIASYSRTVSDADAILTILAQNDGRFPRPEDNADSAPTDTAPTDTPPDKGGGKERQMSPETPYESRFFSVTLDETGVVTDSDTGNIAAIDAESAENAAVSVWQRSSVKGFWGDYRYVRCETDSGCRIIFLDTGRSLNAFRSTLLVSVGVSLGGLLAVFLLLLLFSRRIVRPVAESYEKQKRFITDAGHEIKTPLTIIGADADLLEMDLGDNEWLADIKRQTARLTGLTQDLIYLSRMDEEQPKLQPIEFPLSDLAEELGQSFQNLACAQNKRFTMDIPPMLSLTGDEKAIRQLLSILLDNAVKYTPENGAITLRLKKEGKSIRLIVANDTIEPIAQESLNLLFDRFYRTDQSRNSSTGGYGLGLSIARSIVAAHKGKIKAENIGGNDLTITVTLPE